MELAEAHASRRYDYGEGRSSLCFKEEVYNGNVLKDGFLRHLDELSNHFGALEQKYRYAASHPWLDVRPDPPTPDYP
jgi:hypothetical protein